MMTRRCTIQATDGFSLVELMVAMVIALVLLGGVYQVFVSSNTTYRQTSGLSRLQENGRVSIELVAQEFRRAGFPRFADDGTPFADTVAGVTTLPLTGVEGAGANSDEVTVRYATDTGLRTVRFLHDAAANELERSIDGAVAQPFIDGVESLQILYGVDTDATGTVNAYQNATTVADWNNVLAIRISLLLVTPDDLQKGDLDTNRYDVDGAVADHNGDGVVNLADMRPARTDAHYNTVNEFDPNPDDRNLRQVFRTTIALRNRML